MGDETSEPIKLTITALAPLPATMILRQCQDGATSLFLSFIKESITNISLGVKQVNAQNNKRRKL